MRALLLILWISLIPVSAWSGDVMTAEAARKAALAGELTLVDIRRPDEWAVTGVADVAHAMDMTEPGFAKRLVELYEAHPDRPMALICATGGRSGYVATALEQRGMTRIIDVGEGMMGSQQGPGWLSRKLPVRKADQPRLED